MKQIWIVVLLLAACRSVNDLPPDKAVISFAIQRQDTVVREAVVTVSPGGRRIVMTAGFIAPHPCFSFEAIGDEDGNDINVDITATATGQVCPAVIAHYTYSIVLGNFVPGTYQVKIRHKDSSGSRTIYDQPVNIPF
jgi:hypothetical protein